MCEHEFNLAVLIPVKPRRRVAALHLLSCDTCTQSCIYTRSSVAVSGTLAISSDLRQRHTK